MNSYSTVPDFEAILEFQREVGAVGGELMAVRIPVVLDNGQVDEHALPDAGDGAEPADPVSPIHGVSEMFRLNPGPQNIQVQVQGSKKGPNTISPWSSFPDALGFLQSK